MTSDISVVRRACLTMNFCIVKRLADRVRGGRFGEITHARRLSRWVVSATHQGQMRSIDRRWQHAASMGSHCIEAGIPGVVPDYEDGPACRSARA